MPNKKRKFKITQEEYDQVQSNRYQLGYQMGMIEERNRWLGKIVLTIGCNTHDIARSEELKSYKPMLDKLHIRKIDLADEVLILNVGGYIGESTRSELKYAVEHGKTVAYLEEIK